MRHSRAKLTLGLTQDHRRALLANLTQSLVRHKRIRTTLMKAKAASRYAEKMVTMAKKGTLAARRNLISDLRSQETAKLLVEVVGPAFKSRQGGYTRIIKADVRPGDRAQMAFLEFTEDYTIPGSDEKKKKEKKPKAAKVKEVEPKKTDEAKVEAEGDEKKSSGFLGGLRNFLKGE